ncbi:MAG: hypothetical protein BWK78_04930 [Thiotrichaceae bacterium IS1]|nr:MAG: hypothetical protein BWK78_04930 [Thiotrichaceae bacterium IS1]
MELELVDYLLLDYVSESWTSVTAFFGSHTGLFFNKPAHEIPTRQEIADRIIALTNFGLFSLVERKKPKSRWHVKEVNFDSRALYHYTQQEYQREKRYGRRPGFPRVNIQLTPTGGKVWEEQFQPHWEKYHLSTTDENLTIVQAGSKNFLVEVLNSYQEQQARFEKPIGQLYLQELRPWAAVYWKILPLGYQTYFKTIGGATEFYTQNELRTWRYQWGNTLREGLMSPSQWLIWWQKQYMWLEREMWLTD